MGLLQIHSDGKCVYSSDLLVTPTPKGGTPITQPGSYTMSHRDTVACDITDPDGNHFQVGYQLYKRMFQSDSHWEAESLDPVVFLCDSTVLEIMANCVAGDGGWADISAEHQSCSKHTET